MTTNITPSFITIGERAYKYIRQYTIKSVLDGLVELITNSNDAYNLLNATQRMFEIEIYGGTIVKVRDHAIGLTSEAMVACFLQVGSLTAYQNSRGFFSRGAKDVSALGDITFEAIKDNKYSCCILTSDAYGYIKYADVDVTDEIRSKLGLPGSENGLLVSIQLLPNFQNPNINNLALFLSKVASLRDIVSNPNNHVYIRQYSPVTDNNEITDNIETIIIRTEFVDNSTPAAPDGSVSLNVTEQTTTLYFKLLLEQRISYTYPPGSLLLNVQYTVQDYPDATATFVVYKANQPIDQPSAENQMEFGFLVKDDTTVYEVSTIDSRFRWNPCVNYVYGYLYCPYIHNLMYDYDNNGASPMNPYPILDPSRIGGLNMQHPFIISLYAIPNVRIDAILKSLNSSISGKSVTISDIDSLIKELENYGIELLRNNNVDLSFVPDYQSELSKAIADSRSKYVRYEQSYVMNDKYDTKSIQIENYIKEHISDILSQQVKDYQTAILNGDLNAEPPGKTFAYNDQTMDIYQIPNHVISDPINPKIPTLELFPTEIKDVLEKNPYIYKLGETGNLERLYIFQNGMSDPDLTKENLFTCQQKAFNVIFINDINYTQRYIIDYSNGITIQINLHSGAVSKYLTIPEHNSLTENLVAIGSSKTVVFIQELVTDIIVDLITENDIANGICVLDSTAYNNGKKIIDHRNRVKAKIEMPVITLFEKFTTGLRTAKIQAYSDAMTTVKSGVSDSNLTTYLNQLSGIIDGIVEKIVE